MTLISGLYLHRYSDIHQRSRKGIYQPIVQLMHWSWCAANVVFDDDYDVFNLWFKSKPSQIVSSLTNWKIVFKFPDIFIFLKKENVTVQ